MKEEEKEISFETVELSEAFLILVEKMLDEVTFRKKRKIIKVTSYGKSIVISFGKNDSYIIGLTKSLIVTLDNTAHAKPEVQEYKPIELKNLKNPK